MIRLAATLLGAAVILAGCSSLGDSRAPTAPGLEDATSTPAASLPGDEQTPAPNLDGPNAHDSGNAYRHVQELAGVIGTRVSGTEGERQATEYIRAQFESYGYVVEVEEFSFQSAGRFASVKAGDQEVQAVALEGTRPDGAGGPGVFVGLAALTDLAGVDLAGKVAIADRGLLTFREKYENVFAAGAVGLVIINNQPGIFAGNLGVEAEIPVVGVSDVDGEVLLSEAEAGGTVEIGVVLGTGLNVVARPTEETVCEVIVGGHHDTVPATPGAHDNASGTANVIELARAFAVDGMDEGLCFVTFGGEESGLFGSRDMVARLTAAQQLPQYMVNLDVTGIGSSVEVIGGLDMQQLALAIADDLGIDAVPSLVAEGSSSDHASFQRAGVRVVFLTTGNWAVIHTPGDVVDNIDPDALDLAGRLAYGVIAELLARVAAG